MTVNELFKCHGISIALCCLGTTYQILPKITSLFKKSKGSRNKCSLDEHCILKAGVNPKAVFWLGIMFLMQISRLRYKQSRISMLISHIYVLGCFVNFLVIFRYIWREIVFLKGLVKLMEIGNLEDLLLF